MNKDEVIKFLSYDSIFGILTRQAIEIKLSGMENFNCCLIDINNLKTLNQHLGYEKVNQVIHDVFEEFQNDSDSIVGRWFSGDEIIVIDERIEMAIGFLENISRRHGITFKTYYMKNVKDRKALTGRMTELDAKGGFATSLYVPKKEK